MSRLQLEDFYYMAEDIIDDMDEDDYGRAGGDMDAHEYDMVCFSFWLYVFIYLYLLVLVYFRINDEINHFQAIFDHLSS